MFEIERLFNWWARYYYSPLIMFIVETLTLVIAIKFGRKNKLGWAFIFYIAFDLSIHITDIILNSLSNIPQKSFSRFLYYTNALIALIEFLTYNYFFYLVISNKKIKKIIRLFSVLYLLLIFAYVTTGFRFLTNRRHYVSNALGAFEFILLIPICLYFFKQLLKANTKLKMFERPSFWIATGIFFYASISGPYYLLYDYIRGEYHSLIYLSSTILYYLPFTINFIFIIRAFLCKKNLTI